MKSEKPGPGAIANQGEKLASTFSFSLSSRAPPSNQTRFLSVRGRRTGTGVLRSGCFFSVVPWAWGYGGPWEQGSDLIFRIQTGVCSFMGGRRHDASPGEVRLVFSKYLLADDALLTNTAGVSILEPLESLYRRIVESLRLWIPAFAFRLYTLSLWRANAYLCILHLCIFESSMKAELFNIEDKKDAQRKAEMAMTPSERVLHCLRLMDLAWSINKNAFAPIEDEIEWIELSPGERHGQGF